MQRSNNLTTGTHNLRIPFKNVVGCLANLDKYHIRTLPSLKSIHSLLCATSILALNYHCYKARCCHFSRLLFTAVPFVLSNTLGLPQIEIVKAASMGPCLVSRLGISTTLPF
jgi:hypothetical protein